MVQGKQMASKHLRLVPAELAGMSAVVMCMWVALMLVLTGARALLVQGKPAATLLPDTSAATRLPLEARLGDWLLVEKVVQGTQAGPLLPGTSAAARLPLEGWLGAWLLVEKASLQPAVPAVVALLLLLLPQGKLEAAGLAWEAAREKAPGAVLASAPLAGVLRVLLRSLTSMQAAPTLVLLAVML